jgi:nucleoside-diphosphate-sugar epimerase
LLTARAEELAGEAFNVATGESFRVSEVVDRLTRIAGLDLEPEVGPVRDAKELPYQLLDIAKIKRLGWQPKMSLDDGLRATWAWYRALAQTGRPPPL